ncbi:MAG: HDOD domain-containing protein [Geopsychrobacter sp.]|nr:HDOD domain-containing protein [Geopsychrobacter sp.]
MVEKFMDIDYDIDKLPAMPLVVSRMVTLINSPLTSADELAEVISGDPAISARVLKIANSSFYSMARKVNNLSTAIVILGEKTLKNLVMATSLRGMNTTFGATEQTLWEDSMTCALGARFLARSLRIGDPEEAFIAGLFRHIGRVVFNNQDSAAYKKLMTKGGRCGAGLMALEKERFGLNHAELGAAVLNHWKLSELLIHVVLHHHDEDLSEISDPEIRTMTAIINIASEFPLLLDIFGYFSGEVDLATLPGAKFLGLDSERLDGILEEFRDVFDQNRKEFLG